MTVRKRTKRLIKYEMIPSSKLSSKFKNKFTKKLIRKIYVINIYTYDDSKQIIYKYLSEPTIIDEKSNYFEIFYNSYYSPTYIDQEKYILSRDVLNHNYIIRKNKAYPKGRFYYNIEYRYHKVK